MGVNPKPSLKLSLAGIALILFALTTRASALDFNVQSIAGELPQKIVFSGIEITQFNYLALAGILLFAGGGVTMLASKSAGAILLAAGVALLFCLALGVIL